MSRATKRKRPDLEKPLSFHPFSLDQIVDDLLKIPPTPRVTTPKKTTAGKRRKKPKRM